MTILTAIFRLTDAGSTNLTVSYVVFHIGDVRQAGDTHHSVSDQQGVRGASTDNKGSMYRRHWPVHDSDIIIHTLYIPLSYYTDRHPLFILYAEF